VVERAFDVLCKNVEFFDRAIDVCPTFATLRSKLACYTVHFAKNWGFSLRMRCMDVPLEVLSVPCPKII
jgi:hypothetical protein